MTSGRSACPPRAYHVLREQGTEARSSLLNSEHRPGIFVCAGWSPVFSSAMKFDSGTGWPSFYDHPRRIYDLSRHQVRHGAHRASLRPLRWSPRPRVRRWSAPTGLRYCNNGLALRFIPYPGAKASK